MVKEAVRKLALCTVLASLALPVPALSTLALAARASALSAPQQAYLALAQRGVAQAQRWWNGKLGWYDAKLDDENRYPLATIWDSVPLFEAVDAIAIASPTAADRGAVARFAAGAERYLNRGLRPIPGYSPYQGDREANTETWFDDNGWWGIAFVQAYRATGNHRYLDDAGRALRYIATVGWDRGGGGIWWNTDHPYEAGEALASGTLLATLLYQETHSSFALAQADRFLEWANTTGFSQANQLYAGSSIDATPIDYIESPLIYAQALLCKLTGDRTDCKRAEYLTATALKRFGEELDFAPQYDAIYLQWLLALYGLNGNARLYRLAAANAGNAQTKAADSEGLYLVSWLGAPLPPRDAEPEMLQTQAATTSLFAWLAVYPPPSAG
jgi:hypothetical protein